MKITKKNILSALIFSLAGIAYSATTYYYNGTTSTDSTVFRNAANWAANKDGSGSGALPVAGDIYAIADTLASAQNNIDGSAFNWAGFENNYAGARTNDFNNYFTSASTLKFGYIVQNSTLGVLFRRSNSNSGAMMEVATTIDVKNGKLSIGNESYTGGIGQALKSFKLGSFTTEGDVTTVTSGIATVGGVAVEGVYPAAKFYVSADAADLGSLIVKEGGEAYFYHIAPGSSSSATAASVVTIYNAFTIEKGAKAVFGMKAVSAGGTNADSWSGAIKSLTVKSDMALSGKSTANAASTLTTYAETVTLKNLSLSDGAKANFYKEKMFIYPGPNTQGYSSTEFAYVTMDDVTMGLGGTSLTFGENAKKMDSVTVGTIKKHTSGLAASDTSYLNIYSNSTTIAGLEMSNINSASDKGNTIELNGAAKFAKITFGYTELDLSKRSTGNSLLRAKGSLQVTGDVIAGLSSNVGIFSGTLESVDGAQVNVDGSLKIYKSNSVSSQGTFQFSAAGTTEAEFSFAGIEHVLLDGTTVGDQTRIWANHLNKIIVNLKGTTAGNKTYIFSGRVHDFSSDPVVGGVRSGMVWWDSGKGVMDIVKTGNDTQYFCNQFYTRGAVTIKAGSLYLGNVDAAGKTGNVVNINGYLGYGVKDIRLEGGKLGIVAQTNNTTPIEGLGKVRAGAMEWAGGTIMVDVIGNACDMIQLIGYVDIDNNDGYSAISGTGLLTKAVINTGVFLFEFSGVMDESTEYKVIEWVDGTDFSESDFSTNKLGWEMEIRADGLYAVFIPEPSTYGAIFGILALAFMVYRRRK